LALRHHRFVASDEGTRKPEAQELTKRVAQEERSTNQRAGQADHCEDLRVVLIEWTVRTARLEIGGDSYERADSHQRGSHAAQQPLPTRRFGPDLADGYEQFF
jgi:hypothetical protein